MQNSAFPETLEKDNHTNLMLLVWLRVFAIIGQTAAVAYSSIKLTVELPVRLLLTWICVYAIINAVTFIRLKTCRHITPLEFFIQLFLDIIILSILLNYSGGAANPFVSLYLVPITISAIALPTLSTWTLTAIAIGFYSLILWTSDPIHTHAFHANNFSLHTIGMWLGFIIAAILVSYFVVRMGTTIRNQQKALMDQRTTAIQNEQLVKLGALAASTAHELGTPLGTMQLLIDQIKTNPTQVNQHLPLLDKQLSRCKTALSVLSSTSGQPQALAGKTQNARTFITALLQDWQQLRPDASLSTHWQQSGFGPTLVAETTMQQAIKNILNNSADVSPEYVHCIIDWDSEQIELIIEDKGPGIPILEKTKYGKMPIDSGSNGLGIGLFLSHNIISHFGGKIHLANLENGGLQTHIVLPTFSQPQHNNEDESL